jgi:hypothetical protein
MSERGRQRERERERETPVTNIKSTTGKLVSYMELIQGMSNAAKLGFHEYDL